MMLIEQALSYRDIFLEPRKCIVDSRSECQTSVKLGDRSFGMPIYPSNMKSVVHEETCIYLAQKSMFYTMHRFGVNPSKFYQLMSAHSLFTSISIGVNEQSYSQLDELLKNGYNPQYITLDIANAWSAKGQRMTKFLKEKFSKSFIIVGNVATPDACLEIQQWGADAIKVGIGPSGVCTTKNKTGFHVPMVTAVRQCSNANKCIGVNKESSNGQIFQTHHLKIPIIADGGIRQNGDIAKALACGATMIMAGGVFAGFDQSAGELITIDGKRCKQYYGSASQHCKGKYKNVEGIKTTVAYKGGMDDFLIQMKQDLQSSISYAGGKDLSIFKSGLVNLVKVK